MQFPESWLREFCDPPLSTDELASVLTMSGMEVEEQRRVAPPFDGVVVGEVLAVEAHPNADRLNVCKVDVGTGEILSIVCGAPNVRVGIKVPCALVGAQLPPAGTAPGQPFQIKLGRLRGIESQGMLCSAKELGLSDERPGLLVLAPGAPVGQDIRQHLDLDDTLLTLKLTPNLGHALSVFGVARELSALTGAPLKTPRIEAVPVSIDARLQVLIDAPELCGRFSGRVVHGVDNTVATPAWMVERLARCGQRSVNALVDISNYVMFELGRPSHLFDLDKIQGGLRVRWAHAGERLKLLNGETVELDDSTGVIADEHGVESMAGIMGGDATSVGAGTRQICIEAAFWWPEAVSGRSRRYGFSTEAGHRFERGVDPASTALHLERITRLVLEVCGGAAGPVNDQAPSMPAPPTVSLRAARAAKVIGMPITQAQCADVMQRLGLNFVEEPGVLRVTPPSWRFDLRIEEDLIEEVVRVLGYDRLPLSAPVAPVRAKSRPERLRSSHAVRRRLAGLGYFETINFSFVEAKWERELAGNEDPIRVLNPIASPLSVMRSSLLGSLLHVLEHNLSRKTSRVRVFEIGRVFQRDPQVQNGALTVAGVHQPMKLAGLVHGSAGALQWGEKERPVDYYDIKGDVEALLAPLPIRFVPAEHPALHPGRSARIELDGVVIGVLGELHPRWRQARELPGAPMLFELDLQAVLQRPVPIHTPIAKQQAAWRDLALVASETVTHDALLAAVKATPTPLLRSAQVFDLYKPPAPTPDIAAGERSLAVRIQVLDEQATLTDERIDAVVAQILQTLGERLGVRLRG